MLNYLHYWWKCKVVQSFWKTIWQFLIKLNIVLPYNPTIAFLDICPNELKTYVHTKTCTCMFIAALFISAKTWKQPRYHSVGEWINIPWYIQKTKHFSKAEKK